MSQLSHFNKSYHFPLTDTPSLSIQLLATELNDVDNWYQLGTVLGVPPNRLDGIRKSSPVGGTGEWRIAMLQDWMNSKDDPSWIDVIEAVKSLGYIKLAANLKSKYVTKTTELSHDAGICMCTIRLLCFITLLPYSLYVYHVCVIYYLQLFFYSVPAKVSEVHASRPVVDCVLHVQKCFSQMLTNMRQLSARVNIENVRFFLESILEADEFNTCKGFADVLRLLRKSYIDAFNISYLEQLADYLEIDEINQLISTYKRDRDEFFNNPIVTEFQDAVINKVEHSGEDEIMVPEVRLPHSLVNKRTQRDMETLATLFCDSYQKPAVQMDNLPESKNVTSSWLAHIAVVRANIILLLVVLAIGLKLNSSLSEIAELGTQLTQCQREIKEEVKNLTEVKGMFLAMKEESNLALAEHRGYLVDLLKKLSAGAEEKRINCDENLRKLKKEFHELQLNNKQITKKWNQCFPRYYTCIKELSKCTEAENACREKLTQCETAILVAEQGHEGDQKSLQHSYINELEICKAEHAKLLLNNAQDDQRA